jgi:hypothetical protein
LFTGGTPTSRATATDEVEVKSLSYNSVQGNPSTIALYADDEPPYGFYAVGWVNTRAPECEIRIVYDPLFPNTYSPSDPDPYIWIVGHSASGANPFTAFNMYSEAETTGTNGRCVGTLGSFKGTIPALIYGGAVSPIVPGQGPADPSTFEDYSWPILYARRTGLNYTGYKGTGSIVRWNGRNHDNIATMQNRERLILWDVNLPWDGSSLILG